MPRWQKWLLGAMLGFIPVFFILILPLYVRYYITSTLRVPKKQLLSVPQLINLVSTDDSNTTYPVVIGGTQFQIPSGFTPTWVDLHLAIFRNSNRRIARTIAIASLPQPRTISFSATGLVGWFVSTDMLEFLDSTLWATYHPVKMLCKAHFFVSEAINSQVFEAKWGPQYRGYIFPTSGNTGYIGRIFNVEGKGYFEFSLFDEFSPVSLREWVNLAMRIKPPFGKGKSEKVVRKPEPSLAETLVMAEEEKLQDKAISISLNAFYRTRNPQWLIPAAKVVANRGFHQELINLYRRYSARTKRDKQAKQLWQDLFSTAAKKLVKIEIDPQMEMNELVIYCRSLTERAIRKVKLRITVFDKEIGHAFVTTLFDQSILHCTEEQAIRISPPKGISVRTATAIGFQVEDLQLD